jgi:hypothetical protein
MVDVNVRPFEIEVRTRHGDWVCADVCLPRSATGKTPTLLVRLPTRSRFGTCRLFPPVFPFIDHHHGGHQRLGHHGWRDGQNGGPECSGHYAT